MGGLKIGDVRKVVGMFYSVSREEMLSPARKHKVSHPRQVAMALALELVSGSSSVKIGRHFNRDHSTALVSMKKVRARLDADAKFRLEVEAMRAELLRIDRERQPQIYQQPLVTVGLNG